MTARRQAVARRASRPSVLTLTQRVERLERQYFSQKPAAAGARFTAQGEVVQDRATGLMWTRKSVGDKAFKWKEAQAAASAVRIDGHQDWRLPTIQELLTLVDYSRTSPAIDPIFEYESIWYWSATPYASSPGVYAWCVHFTNGGSNYVHQDHESFVRAVRVGQ
jgi:hypothetical protein